MLQNPPKEDTTVINPMIPSNLIRRSLYKDGKEYVLSSKGFIPLDVYDKSIHENINSNVLHDVYDKSIQGNINSNVLHDAEPEHFDTPKITQDVDMMPTEYRSTSKSCCWGDCTSRIGNLDPGAIWIPFPKPCSDPKKARVWADLSGMGCSEITEDTYICSLHFFRGTHLDHT